MLTIGMQNLLEPMARAPVACHGGTARLAPASADRLARRVEYFASSVQFVLDDPDAARRLQVLRGRWRTWAWSSSITSPSWRTSTPPAAVRPGKARRRPSPTSAPTRASSRTGRSLPLRDSARSSPRPLVDYAGHLIGMVSTHFRRPHRPSDRDLQIVELYADFAGEALTARLGRPPGDGPADPVGRAMVTTVPDPARVREADVSVPFELWVMGRMTISFVRRAGRPGPSAQPV